METPKQLFTLTTEQLKALFDVYQITDNETGNSTAAMLGQYMKKSYKTGTFQITKIGLLREATWARKNGLDEWATLVSNWAATIN